MSKAAVCLDWKTITSYENLARTSKPASTFLHVSPETPKSALTSTPLNFAKFIKWAYDSKNPPVIPTIESSAMTLSTMLKVLTDDSWGRLSKNF